MAKPPLVKPTQRTLTVHCAVCGHQWCPAFPLPMPIDRAVVAMKGIVAAGCPRCGAHGRDVMSGPRIRNRK